MFKYLERILGKPIKYYETLMTSKAENFTVKEVDIQSIINSLTPYVVPATTYKIDTVNHSSIELKNSLTVPKNKKKESLPLVGTFIVGDEILLFFLNEEKVIKDSSNYCLTIKKSDDFLINNEIILNQSHASVFDTVPIWEEIIHRFPKIHQLILSLNPQNPWTLYKKAVTDYKITDRNIILGGYPQWRINNIDFRKIKNLKYLMEYRIDDKKFSVYFFKDPKTQEIKTIEQRD
ncbi:hypothetical protein [Nonlabens sp.]|uniref:hypothetical protein n=1 Tax=Nonlabens sp. TaxID=1888209 RepID=UPI003F69D77F